MKKFADNNFRFDKNGREFSKRLENSVGKGEIACYEQFLLFPQCFQKTCTADREKGKWPIFFFCHNVFKKSFFTGWFTCWNQKINLKRVKLMPVKTYVCCYTILTYIYLKRGSCVCETLMPQQQPFFWKLWPWYLIMTLTDGLELGTNRKVLSQGILMWNRGDMKALSPSNQKIWPM